MDRIFITPLANKLASLNSINIENVTGTGPRGRITKIDIEKHLTLSPSTLETNQKKNAGQGNAIDHEIIDIPKIRRLIAEKLSLSKSSIPHFYLRRKARVNELINNKRGITPSTALRLGKYFGTSPDFWLNLQRANDLYAVLKKEQNEIDKIKPFSLFTER